MTQIGHLIEIPFCSVHVWRSKPFPCVPLDRHSCDHGLPTAPPQHSSINVHMYVYTCIYNTHTQGYTHFCFITPALDPHHTATDTTYKTCTNRTVECCTAVVRFQMNALKCRTLRAMSSCHCGQTMLGGMINGNSPIRLQRVTIMHMHAFCRKMADFTYGFQWRECWISATERFQRKLHNFFDLCCPLSMWQ